MTSTIVGFALDDAERPLLDKMVERYGCGNRSAFLRVAIKYMQRQAIAEDLLELQSYGEERLAAAGLTLDDIPALCDTEPSPMALEAAKRIVASVTARWPEADTVRESDSSVSDPTAMAFLEDLRASGHSSRL